MRFTNTGTRSHNKYVSIPYEGVEITRSMIMDKRRRGDRVWEIAEYYKISEDELLGAIWREGMTLGGHDVIMDRFLHEDEIDRLYDGRRYNLDGDVATYGKPKKKKKKKK